MSTTNTISCNLGAWTQVSSGSASVSVQGPPFSYRVAVAASAPSSTSNGIVVSEPDGIANFTGLASTDCVWVVPIGQSVMSVSVIAS